MLPYVEWFHALEESLLTTSTTSKAQVGDIWTYEHGGVTMVVLALKILPRNSFRGIFLSVTENDEKHPVTGWVQDFIDIARVLEYEQSHWKKLP